MSGITIREASENDLSRIENICLQAFMLSIAPNVTDEGIAHFRSIASVEQLDSRRKNGSILLVCEQQHVICGVIELRNQAHLAMLFVDPVYQKKGVGRALVSEILSYVSASILTVKASLPSVPAYRKYGFECDGPAEESSGLPYQKMIRYV